MTHRHDDPFLYLPFAIAGLVVGVGLAVLSGFFAVDRWGGGDERDGYVSIEGTISRASWVRSVEEPTRFLQIRLEEDARGFLVTWTELAPAFRDRLREADRHPQAHRGRLSRLEGRPAVIVVAERFQEQPDLPNPYMRTLRIDGEPVVPAESDAEPEWRRWIVRVLLGLGLLVGCGLGGLSLHHLLVWLRHRRAS